MAQLKVIPEFETIDEAYDWMEEAVSAPFVDNRRFAYQDNEVQLRSHYESQCNGCCGFFDATIKVGGRLALIGCNYGH